MEGNREKLQAEALYRRGNELRKQQQWADAINAYEQAAALDPQSPAVAAKQMLNDILAFRCNDYYNP